MKFRITHSTRYEYEELIPLSHNLVLLRPRDHTPQVCLWHELQVSPTPAIVTVGLDYFGNYVTWFSLQEPHTELLISSRSEVHVDPQATRPDVSRSAPWEHVAQNLNSAPDQQTLSAKQFCFESPHVPLSSEIVEYARVSFAPGRPYLQCVLDLTQRIFYEFEFLPGSTAISTPVADVFRSRQGVCQDFAHLQITCLRSMGLAARYVSGYIATHPPPGQERFAGADASHAWISVYTPEFGWVDFDPTNGLMPSDAHITVAWGRDYNDVGPAKGILLGGQHHSLSVLVDVVPVEA